MHLPIMHRDYFYIPGYSVGYKISISYIGFVFLILCVLRDKVLPAAVPAQAAGAQRWRRHLWVAIPLLFVAGSVLRATLGQAPKSFPW